MPVIDPAACRTWGGGAVTRPTWCWVGGGWGKSRTPVRDWRRQDDVQRIVVRDLRVPSGLDDLERLSYLIGKRLRRVVLAVLAAIHLQPVSVPEAVQGNASWLQYPLLCPERAGEVVRRELMEDLVRVNGVEATIGLKGDRIEGQHVGVWVRGTCPVDEDYRVVRSGCAAAPTQPAQVLGRPHADLENG